MKRSVTILLALLALSGCKSLPINIQNPSYSFRDIRPRVAIGLPLSASSIDFDMEIEVANPNSVALRLDRIDFDLLVNDSRLMSGVTSDQIRIPARGNGQVHVTTRVGYDQLRSMFREVADLIQGNRAHYQLRGTASYDTPLGTMRFPLTVSR